MLLECKVEGEACNIPKTTTISLCPALRQFISSDGTCAVLGNNAKQHSIRDTIRVKQLFGLHTADKCVSAALQCESELRRSSYNSGVIIE